jgi:hypothetical protein
MINQIDTKTDLGLNIRVADNSKLIKYKNNTSIKDYEIQCLLG